MAKYFDPEFINGPFDDPGLFVDLAFERRAILFDLGDISALAPRKMLRLAHIFVSHRHMDHFAGFDRLLRCLLGREKLLNIWGPPGLIAAVENKINAYTWDIVTSYRGNLQLCVSELTHDGKLLSASFCGNNRFRRQDQISSVCYDGTLVSDPGYSVRTVFLEHSTPVLAFSLKERARINIWRNRVAAMGLAVGPWLNRFKDAVLSQEDDMTPIPVQWAVNVTYRPTSLPLGELKSKIMKTVKGRKITYVVDAGFTLQNQAAILSLARDADILFIETAFLAEDAELAAARNHLTTTQAGQLARRANVQQLRTFHYSSRYRDREWQVVEEAQAAFLDVEAQFVENI